MTEESVLNQLDLQPVLIELTQPNTTFQSTAAAPDGYVLDIISVDHANPGSGAANASVTGGVTGRQIVWSSAPAGDTKSFRNCGRPIATVGANDPISAQANTTQQYITVQYKQRKGTL